MSAPVSLNERELTIPLPTSSSYIGARLIWGTWNSYNLFVLLFSPKAEAANVGPIRYLYIGLNIMLNGLNFFWFRAMVLALKKR